MVIDDAVTAAGYQAEEPAVLAANVSESAPEPAGEGSVVSSENTPRELRDPPASLVVPFAPTQIFVPDAEVNTTVDPRPATEEFNPFLGGVVRTFPVPDGPFTTVWWDEGPRPGDDGLAVILGHTRTPRAAVFNDLPGLTQGAQVALSGLTDDGEAVVARYVVEKVVTGISKTDEEALRDVLVSPPERVDLALITCSGVVDERLSSRTDNTVVFASLVGMYPDTGDG